MLSADLLPYVGAFLIGLSKAGFATGLSLLTTPLLATMVPAREVIGIILPLLIASDLFTLAAFWRQWEFKLIRWPLVGCVLGIIVGMLLLNSISDTVLKRSIGGLGLVLTALLLIRNIWYPEKSYRPSNLSGASVGAIAGFASTLAHAAGPIMAIFFLAQKTEKTVFVATNAIFFTLNNLMKLPPYVASGLIRPETLWIDLRLLPLIPVGVGVGWLLNRYIPQKAFVWIVYTLMMITSTHLLLRG